MECPVVATRAFNRFYTRHVGALDARFLGGALTLPEARVLYELATRAPVTARDIAAALGMDPGYLSRVLRRFAARGWTAAVPAPDARRRPLGLTEAGRSAFDALDERQRAAVEASLARLDAADAQALATALGTVRNLLGEDLGPPTIREFRDGDMGAIVTTQSRYYAAAHGWRGGMEALILDVAAGFLRDHVPGRTNCWVAERAGALVGSVFVVDAGNDVAQLRMLHVEACARGHGLGAALVGRCVELARAAGYGEIMLWTHSVLLPARRIYEAVGFRHVSSEPHGEFGVPVEGETWRLTLGDMTTS